jgi:DNA-binding transcriptional regulator YhcF (GntR family)
MSPPLKARPPSATVLEQGLDPDPAAAPYQRIAGSLRRRIESGRLRPGDRVPSTRALARKWGVALATAAHALNTLVADGWVQTVPRVGSVVAGDGARAAREPVTHAPPLPMRQKIINCAIAIADGEGLAALSLRGVAARLQAPVTSLYRHVKSKDELLHRMTDAVLGEEPLPPEVPTGWRAQLELAARLQWRTLRRHPWLARLMSITRPRPLVGAIGHADWVLRALDVPGLDASQRMHLHIVLHGFVQGMAVNLETEADAASETGISDAEWMDTQTDAFTALAATGRYPAFAAVLRDLASGFQLDLDTVFELGLRTMLDGFDRLIRDADPRRPARARGRAPPGR